MNDSFIDFHCHPHMKPYGKSFKDKPWGKNTLNRKSANSIWFYDPPNIFERLIQLLAGIVKCTQADCTTLHYGNVRIICASLYPIEKGFFANDLGTGTISDLAGDFITSISKPRVSYIQGIKDYFEDVQREYDYYLQLHDKEVRIDNETYTYVLVSSFAEIEQYKTQFPNRNPLFVLISIEGLHVLNNNLNAPADAASFLSNLEQIKNWRHKPFFVTVAHHFYNELCGHARSLTGLVGNKTDQSLGLNTSFTPMGKQVLEAVLDKGNGRRILVDVKHMSAAARREYYTLLVEEYRGENIPVIISHGACNGMRSMQERVVDHKETGFRFLAEDINFYDEEILMVARTRGIFGLQLDERRIAGESTLKAVKHSAALNKVRHYRAELLWNQVQHIAELLDHHGLFAWECMVIGSDYDGIINPLNGYTTAETMPHLLEYLERYAYNYMESRGKQLLKSHNQISPSEIVNRIFSTNGYEFLRRNF
jgi:microsomal dipeptidase-like Zn-dependent dipeptidase